MPQWEINDLDDPRLAPYRALNRSNLCRLSGRFIVEGHRLVERLLASRYPVESILLCRRFRDRLAPGVDETIPVYVATDELVSQLVGFHFHRGALACGLRLPPPRLEEILAPKQKENAPVTLVVCPYIQDSENLGGIIRNAAAFGVDAILTSSQCADPFCRRVVRVSMGTVFKIPLIESADLEADLREMGSTWQIERVATVLDGRAEPLARFRRSPRTALLFGSEGYGLEDRWLRLSDRLVTIPMQLGTDSLNVAVSTGIFLYHFMTESGRSPTE